jgi:N-acetylneuraminic acid mutarotase
LSNADVVYYEGNIYTYGGNAYGRTNSIYRYNVNTDTLYKLSVKLDLETTSHRVVLVGSKVYILGGLGNSGARRFSVLVHDLEKQTLEELDVTLPFGLNCFQVGYYENCVYIIGGTGSNGNFSKIYSFDLETYEFKELPVSLPTVVFKGAWCFVGKYAYVIGGTNGKRLTSIYRFDMENHTLETMNATLPEQISQSRAVYDGEGNIYIYGGTNESNKLVDCIVKYNIASDKAELMNYKLPLILANICVAKTEKGIYILGGNNEVLRLLPPLVYHPNGNLCKG